MRWHIKPSYKSRILEIVEVILVILLFNYLKSELKQTIPYLFRIIKVGDSHLELFLRFGTPILLNLVTTVFGDSLCILGIGNGSVI